MKPKITKTPLVLCPSRGHHQDCAFAPFNQQYSPRPGDLTICAYCRGVLRYTDGLGVRPVSDDELVELSDLTQAKIAMLREMICRHPPPNRG
jgi:hypothetical protein